MASAGIIDTLVIGAGQAGLSMSYYLSRAGRSHLIVERGRVAERWHSERWDSLVFQFPNWSLRLPGFAYSGGSPDDFATRDEVVRFVEAYARHIAAPVKTGVAVHRLRQSRAGFLAETSDGPIDASNVVVATGPYQRPFVPPVTDDRTSVHQLHASKYRSESLLPEGGVLIVGAGASGAQIAEELAQAGRPVWLAVGSHRRVPRRYRGHDFHYWELALGEWDRARASRVVSEPPPLLTGVRGGQDMDLRRLAHLGVTLTGRVKEIACGVARFHADLAESLAVGDEFYRQFVASVDAYATQNNLALPSADAAPPLPDPPTVAAPVRELDLAAAGVSSLIWATGFRLDLRWIELPLFDSEDAPVHVDGVTSVSGLYFLGLPWLSKRKSTLLSGVGEDAERIARHICNRSR